MTFRVTSLAIENQAILYATRHSAEIFRLQQQITSGVRLQRPSDDPVSFRQISSLNTRFSELAIELATVRSTEAILNNSVSQLQESSQLITAAISAVQQGIQATETIDRNALALEVEGILAQLQSVANSTFGGEYLYGGTQTNRPPFEFGPPAAAGRSLTSNYVGSTQNSVVLIGTSLAIDNFYSGQQIFGRGDRQSTVLYGATGAATGRGTDTLVARANLLVSHNATTFTGGSGIVAGSRSPDSDTIIGSHQLEIIDTSGNGTAGTISLNGGEAIAFTNPQPDLQVIGPRGEIVFVNTTGLTAGFSGRVGANASGFLSVDGGQSQTAIDFSDHQIVTDSLTGGFVTIDSRAIAAVGQDSLEFPGTSDVFQLLHDLAADLRNSRSLNGKDLTDTLNRRFGELENAQERVLGFLGEQSTSLRTLDSVGFRNESLQLQIQTQASDLQATDISDAVLRLSNAEALLQYTFAVTAQITSVSILDFLR